MKAILIFCLAIFLIACDKEYFPDENKYRDERLLGTWIKLEELNSSNPTIKVYNNDGYCGATTSYNNEQSNFEIAFQNIDGIWHVKQANDNNNFKYNRIYSQKRFRNGIWQHTEEYYFQNDTLFLRDLRYDWDTLVKYKYQLIYDGPTYIGIDSIN